MARNTNPWCKIYYRDWLESERIMEMSCAAEGVYMRCLLMQTVRTNLPQNLHKLALLLRKPVAELEKVWHEVEPHFDLEEVDGEPRLYNARHREHLLEYAGKSKNYSKAARKREQAKRKHNCDTTPPQSEQDCALRASVSVSASVSDSASKKKGSSKKDADPLGKDDPQFCEFYEAFPRKVNRRDAFATYLKHVKSDADHAKLVSATQKATTGIFKGRPVDKIPYPSVWINALNWKDDSADLSTPSNQRPGVCPTDREGFMRHDKSKPAPAIDLESLNLEDVPF